MTLHSSSRTIFRPTTTPVPSEETIIKPPTDGPREFRVAVDYPSRMTMGTMQTVRVEIVPLEPIHRMVDLGRPLAQEPLPLRFVLPGALISPPEQGLEPSPYETVEAHFHVTPLATGDLPLARVEVLRGSFLDAIDVPMRCHGQVQPWILTGLTFLIPLLLHLPAWFAEPIKAGIVQREIIGWMPGLPFRDAFAGAMQYAAEFLATTGAQGRLSFFTFLGLLGVTVWLLLARRPHREKRFGETFSLGVSSRGNLPPNYLQPVSTADI